MVAGVTINVCRDGAEVGDYTGGEFEQAIRLGAVRLTDYYWTEGMSDWRLVCKYRSAGSQPVAVTHTVRTRPETSVVRKVIGAFFGIVIIGGVVSQLTDRAQLVRAAYLSIGVDRLVRHCPC